MNIYINNIAKWKVSRYDYLDHQMGLRSISLTINHPSNWIGGDAVEVADFTDAYVIYENERYNISSAKPTGTKDNTTLDYTYELTFKGAEEQLTRRKVRDLALVGVDNFISQGTSFSIYANLSQFQQLLQNNLTYYFGDEWTVNLLTTSSDVARIDINNTNIWELILKTYEYFGLRWRVTGKTINIGYTPDVVEHVFDYGKEGGLVKITRTAQSDAIINRLIGTGSSKNIPVNYFTDRYDKFPKDPNPISDTANIRTLMPKVFRDSVIAGNLPYIDYVEDPELVEANGVIEGVEEVNDEIYPSIAGVEVDGLGRIDQIIASSIPVANSADEDGYSQVFDIWVKDIGFDLIDDKYTSTSDAKISFTSGALAGYEFTILVIGGVRQVSEDTSKSHNGVSSKYKITLIKSDEDFNATGRMLPNKVLYARSDDSFVIYDIEMPQSYVELAEERFEAWLIGRLNKRKVDSPTYAIDVMDSFFYTHTNESDGKTIQEKVKVGNKIKINNTAITDGVLELHISQLTVQYGGVLPKYTFIVTDNVDENRGAIAKLQSSINRVSSKQVFDKQEIQSNSHTHANKMVLDLFKQDSDGNVYLEQSFYSMGGISALGLGEGGSGGGGGGGDFSRLDRWTDYTAPKAGWVLSALLGYDLHTRVNSLEDSGGSSNIDIAITGPGNAVTNVSKSGNTLTFDKGINFALSTHNHTIAQVTGLQTALDSKEPSFTKNTAFNKNFGTVAGTVMQGNDSRIHSHSNKPILDQITQSNIDVLSKLSIVDGNIKVDTNLWATGGISALGLGEGGGGGGGGVDMLDAWANYTTAKANFYAPASLLVPFRNDTLSRLTSLESGSATSIVTTGSGNAITSLTKSGSVITATKGLTFALASHTHTIAQITGLQGALDLKASQSDIDTAIDGIEIGGRNLVLDTEMNDTWGRTWGSGAVTKTTDGYKVTMTGLGQHAMGDYFTEDIIRGETYTISFKARGNINLMELYVLTASGENVKFHGSSSHQLSTTEFNKYSIVFTYNSANPSEKLFIGGQGASGQWLEVKRNTVMFEKGNKATDWTPAPEDQISDWSESNASSFSYIKNKPTQLSQFTDNIGVASHIANKSNPHNVTTSQIGAVDLTTNQNIGGVKTFTNKVISTVVGSKFGPKDGLPLSPQLGQEGNTFGIGGDYGLRFNVLGSGIVDIQVGRFTGAARAYDLTLQSQGGNVGIGTTTPLYKLDVSGTGRFTGNVTAPTFVGALTGNASSATKLQTARTIAGVSFDGTANIAIPFANLASKPTTLAGYGITDAVTTNTTQTITGAKTFSTLLTASAGINTPKVIFAAAGWSLEQVGTELQMKHNGVIKQRMLSDGTILATGGITALTT